MYNHCEIGWTGYCGILFHSVCHNHHPIFIMEELGETADLLHTWILRDDRPLQTKVVWVCQTIVLSTGWQNDTKSRACSDSICNHTEQSVESRVKALWGAIWTISKQHLPQPHQVKKKLSAEELSSFWTHNCPPLPLQPHYSTIWLQGGKQRKRMKNTIHHRWGGCRSVCIFVNFRADPPFPA